MQPACRLGLYLLFLTSTALAAATSPTLRFDKSTLEAQNLTPGGTVVWFGIQKSVVAYEVSFSRVRQVGIVDAKGGAALNLGKPPSARSVWLAVDLSSGAYAVAAPPGSAPPALRELPPGAVASRGATLPDQLADAADYAEVLLVRPGAGAWSAVVGRGGALDEAAPGDPTFRLSLDRLTPLASTFTAAPQKAASKDLLVVVHPDTLFIAAIVLQEVKP